MGTEKLKKTGEAKNFCKNWKIMLDIFEFLVIIIPVPDT
jgi:hypothetical protein